MIHPFRFIWRQMNGPQITGIFTAFFRWIRKEFDATLDYLNNFSIETASDPHLTLIGAIMGLVRPRIDFSPIMFFWFTDGPLNHSEHGYSDWYEDEPRTGGVFSDLHDPSTIKVHEPMPARWYRPLLKAWVDDGVEGTSLALLDSVIASLWDDIRKVRRAYNFVFLTENDLISNRGAGDIEVWLGPQEPWEDFAPFVVGMVNGIATTLYNPLPRLYPQYSGPALTTEDGEFIYTEEELIIEVNT